MESLDEYSLINLYNQNKDEGFEKLFRRFYPIVFTTSYNLIDDEKKAKDISTKLFLNLWKQREPLSSSVSLKHLLRNKIIESSIKQIRAHRKLSFALRGDESSYKLGPIIFDYETDNRPLVAKIIAALPEKCKLVYRLSRFESFKHKEIAEMLDTSKINVEKEMLTALRLIREGLERFG